MLHRRGMFWIVADIIAELVPTGRAAVDAHKALYDHLGPDYVSLPSLSHRPCICSHHIAPLSQITPAKALSRSTSQCCLQVYCKGLRMTIPWRKRADAQLHKLLSTDTALHCCPVMQCADVHILMIDRGNLDRACQLTAAAVINQQSQVVLDVMTAIISDKVFHTWMDTAANGILNRGSSNCIRL